MPIRLIRPASLVPLFFVAVFALSSYACDDDGVRTAVGPSRLTAGPAFLSHAVSVEPADIIALPVPGALCPTVPPFTAPLNLVIRSDGVSDLQLREVRMQFIDRTGFHAPFRTLTQSDLGSLFGSTVVPAFGTRTFPFSFPFGCIGSDAGTLTVLVVAVDSHGREARTSLQVGVLGRR